MDALRINLWKIRNWEKDRKTYKWKVYKDIQMERKEKV